MEEVSRFDGKGLAHDLTSADDTASARIWAREPAVVGEVFRELDKLIRRTAPAILPAILAALAGRMGEVAARLLTEHPEPEPGQRQPDKNLSARQAAERLSMSESWVYRNKHKLPTVRIGRRVLFPARKLDHWIERRRER